MSGTLRLEWPQYQGGEPAAVIALTPGLTEEESRLAYGVGGELTAVLAPRSAVPTARIDVAPYRAERVERDGVVEKDEILRQNGQALALLREHDAERVVTLGGTCAVTAAPFSYLADRYGDDLVVVWLDSHPDCNLPGGLNHGFNTMVVTHLIGRGDAELLAQLPGRLAPEQVVLAGTHGWDDQDPANIEGFGLQLIPPAAGDRFIARLVEWIAGTGRSKAAIHFDLDVIDANEVSFGMAPETDGISAATALGAIAAVEERFDLVGLTVAEFVPREATRLRSILGALPLLSPSSEKETDSL